MHQPKLLPWYFRAFLFASLFPPIVSCHSIHRNKTHPDVAIESIKSGEALAKIYCQTCHMLPDPSLADTKSWENGILPQMGPRLGIFYYNFEQYPRQRNKFIGPEFYPSQPALGLGQWQDILNYYEATSPDTMPPQQKTEQITVGLPLFQVEIPPSYYFRPTTCYVKFNTSDTAHSIVISDAFRKNLYFFNRNLVLTDSVVQSGPVVDIDYEKNGLLACDIGMLNPNDGKSGKAFFIKKGGGHYQMDTTAFLDSLQRPVQVTPVDLNQDGRLDYIFCEFGNLTGALSWMENTGNNHFLRHVIRQIPGAIKVYVNDYNHDGLPDIWALFAQGDEGIFLFTNKGHGNFESREVLRFPPSYGSSSFELDDFNKDGFPDILYTCGDNADFSQVLKPYHGVYIFINDGTNHFTQKYFYPINGCYKAMARDFDGDGDLDLATISYFADYLHQPEEGFVYLENKGDFHFFPYSIPQAGMGRWLTMDAGDLDGDGKLDIILGNFSATPSQYKHPVDWKKSPPFIVLRNVGK